MRLIEYTRDEISERVIESPDHAASSLEGDRVCWIDVQGLGDEDVLRRLAEIFSIHPLALEDVVNVPQRPKTETYEHHELYISRMIRNTDDGSLDREQVSIFFSDRYVLTFQERYGDVLDPVRARLRAGKGPMRRSGPDYLAYAIIDAIIDGYYPVAERLSEQLEGLEDAVMARPSRSTLEAINRIKRDLLVLRRAAGPQRDAMNTLVRGDSPFVTEQVRVYLRDCYDHCVQLADVVETNRELASGLLNTYLTAISNRTNDIMKVLTIMASIFIPLTFLAGIYGMNFENMPETKIAWFYPFLLLVMAVTAFALVVYFWRRGWIGGRGDDG